jgi:hypothetical protein
MLQALDNEASQQPWAPGKWSPRQIIGHLIDSAANNHARFVRAQIERDLVFPGYDQDGWVAAQGYHEAPWPDLVTLWAAYNRHIAWVMRSTPVAALSAPRERHSLNAIAWKPVPADRPTSLAYLMRDYVAHLHHHLRQIFGDRWTEETGGSLQS